MTPAENSRISRSFYGHITTDQSVRDKLAAAGDDHNALADVINQTVAPNYNVRPEDIPGIKTAYQNIFRGVQYDPETTHVLNLIEFQPPHG